MSQNDFNIANQGFPSFRSDLNGALRALASNSAGTSAPAATYAYMWWYDSTNDILKMRNADNDAWIDFASFDQANDRWAMAGSGDTGLYFDAANDALLPWNTDSGVVRDSAIDLGSSSARFKDLYLSGGVYLGGTGAANLLDDYEEGTWTPTVVGTTVAGTGIYSVQTGRYTKVGNLVTVFGHYSLTAHTGSGNLRITGLPFTAANVSNLYTIGQWSTNNITYDANVIQAYVFSTFNTTSLDVSQLRDAASNLPVVLDANHMAWFSISYYV